MKVDAILDSKGREVKTVGPSATLATVAQRLRLERIGSLVVVEGDRILGLISERDIVYAFAADRERAAGVEVAEVISRDVITCDSDDSLTRVLSLMTRHRVRHIPVVRSGQLLGLISIGWMSWRWKPLSCAIVISPDIKRRIGHVAWALSSCYETCMRRRMASALSF